MKFQIALLGFDTDHDRLLRFHLAHTRGQAHEFAVTPGRTLAGADIAVVDLDAPDATELLGALQAAPEPLPRIEVSDEGCRGTSAYRLARPDALSSLPRQLQRVVDTGILVPPGTPSLSDLDSPDPTLRLLAAAARDDRSDATPIRALVIDADAAVRSDLEAGLRRLGVVGTGHADAAALEPALRRQPFDLLFLDARADGGNGYTLCRRMRRDSSLTLPPLIMLCGPTTPFDRARAALCGCTAWLPKPLPWSDFRRLVADLLRQSSRRTSGDSRRRRPPAAAGMGSAPRPG